MCVFIVSSNKIMKCDCYYYKCIDGMHWAGCLLPCAAQWVIELDKNQECRPHLSSPCLLSSYFSVNLLIFISQLKAKQRKYDNNCNCVQKILLVYSGGTRNEETWVCNLILSQTCHILFWRVLHTHLSLVFHLYFKNVIFFFKKC